MDPVNIPIEDSIDLHSFPPADVAGLVEEYLYQAQQKGFREVRIIHGRGIGVQRQMVHSLLSRNSRVLRYYDAPDRGSTHVLLKTEPS
jgi:DNA-nicking Smr family endonuclease